MYRILLVDDEGLELSSLKMIVEKEFGEEVLVETASSGRLAIEKYDTFRPEITVMDIQMPGINGLDAIREIKKNHVGGRFLMLTAYDTFDYVQQAMNLGVSAYITKPFNRSKLADKIRELMSEIDEERSKRSEDLMLRERLDAAVPMLQNGFIYSVLLEQDWDGVTSNYLRLLGVGYEFGYMLVIDFDIEANPGNSEKFASHSKKINSTIKEFFRESITQQMGKRSIVATFINQPNDEYATRLQIINKATQLQARLEELVGVSTEIGIGGIHPVKNIVDSYRQALSTLREKSGSVAHFSDLPIDKNWEEGYPQEAEYAIYNAAEEGNAKDVIQKAEEFFAWMAISHAEDVSDVQLKVLELVMRVEYIVFHNGGRTYHFMERHGYLEDVTAMSEMSELRSWFLSRLSFCMDYITEVKEEATTSAIEKACAIINNQYMDNLTLNDIAEQIHISPYYFSKLFKDKTGRNFIEYLTTVRMEKAKHELLHSDLSVKEICMMVGYGDPNYFSRSFKKYEGVTPGEFREAGA